MTSDRNPKADTPSTRRRRSEDPIAMGLRRLWTDVEDEAVPDDFLSLLDEIDTRRAQKASVAGSADGTAGEAGSADGTAGKGRA